MHHGRVARTGHRSHIAGTALLVLGAALAAVSGCSSSHGAQVLRHPTFCGTAHTAAGVPVEIEITKGSVACQVALAVEHAYAATVASGKVRGNGGGAPVRIHGWLCQGFNTPKVLATGRASACHKNGAEILAVLPAPSPSASL